MPDLVSMFDSSQFRVVDRTPDKNGESHDELRTKSADSKDAVLLAAQILSAYQTAAASVPPSPDQERSVTMILDVNNVPSSDDSATSTSANVDALREMSMCNYDVAESQLSRHGSQASVLSQSTHHTGQTSPKEMYSFTAHPPAAPPTIAYALQTVPSSRSGSSSDTAGRSRTQAYNVFQQSFASEHENYENVYLHGEMPTRAQSEGSEQTMFGHRPASILQHYHINRASSWNSRSSSNGGDSAGSRSEMRGSVISNGGRPNFFVERARQLALRRNSGTSITSSAGQPVTPPTSPGAMTRATSSMTNRSMGNLLGGYGLWRGRLSFGGGDAMESWPLAGLATSAERTQGGDGAQTTNELGGESGANAVMEATLPMISSSEEQVRSSSGRHFTTNCVTTTTTVVHVGGTAEPQFFNGARIFRGSFDNDASLDSSPFIVRNGSTLRTDSGSRRRVSQVGFVYNSSNTIRLTLNNRNHPSSFSVSAVDARGNAVPVANAAATWRLLSFKKQDDGPVKRTAPAETKRKKKKSGKSSRHKSRHARKATKAEHAPEDDVAENAPAEPTAPDAVRTTPVRTTPPFLPPAGPQRVRPPAPDSGDTALNETHYPDDTTPQGRAVHAWGDVSGRPHTSHHANGTTTMRRLSYANGASCNLQSAGTVRGGDGVGTKSTTPPSAASTAARRESMFQLPEARVRTSPGGTARPSRGDAREPRVVEVAMVARRTTVRRTPFLYRLLNARNDARDEDDESQLKQPVLPTRRESELRANVRGGQLPPLM